MNRIVKLSQLIGSSLLLLVLIFASMPVAVLAAPGDETTVGTVSLVPTIECIGVTSSFTGDNNQNNNATLEYRESGTSTWKSAPEMYADRDSRQYRGSIFWLTTNTDYEVRVTYQDSDGTSGSPAIVTIRTRNDNPPSNGDTYYVSTTGSDSNSGTQASPFRTIQKAANTVSPGDTVLVRAGTYSELVSISSSGQFNNYITFQPFASEQVTIDGNGSLRSLFNITGSYIRIKGFTIRRSYDRSAVILSGGDGVIIEDNKIENPDVASNGHAGIRLDSGASNSIIQRNLITIYEGSAGNRGTIYGICWWKPGDGHVMRNNEIRGGASFRDGMGGGPEDEPSTMNDSDFYDNFIVGAQDDGIQPEGGGVNLRIWGNRIEDSFLGIAVCPSLLGPTYIFRNAIVYGLAGEYKLGDDSYGRIYMYHNTYYSQNGNGYSQTNTGLDNIVSRNNIVRAGRYVFEMRGANHDFDYDALYTSDPTRFAKWDGSTLPSMELFQSRSGQEAHGFEASDFGFVDISNKIS